MRTLSLTVVAACAWAGSALGQTADPGPRIDAVFARWATPASPGCAVSVSDHDKVIFERGYGQADLEHGIANGPSTRFEAGSVSKQFTAAATLLLVESGKLKLTDDVRKYVPELPDYGAPITIEHLLTHTSGLRDWGVVADAAGWDRGTRIYTQADVLDIARRQKSLNYRPGAEYSYTNTGFNLLAIIVQRVSGQSLADFTRARLFQPLGMTSTSWRDDFRRVVPGRAIAYQPGAAGYRQDMPFENAYGNGGLITTVGDLALWNAALDQGRLGPFVTRELQRNAKLGDGTPIVYARGLFVSTYHGVPEVSHSGSTAGYRAWLGRYPSQGVEIALLCNAADTNTTVLAHQVADLFLPPAPAVPAPPAPAPAELAGLAGLFVQANDGTSMALTLDGDRLRTDRGVGLAPLGGRKFRLPTADITFETADRFLMRTTDGNLYRYDRTPRAAPTPAQLAAYAGRFRSEEADATYLVSVDGAGLMIRIDRRPEESMRLVPLYADAFQTPEGVVRFKRDKTGRVTALSLGVPRVRDLRFARIG